MTETISCWKHRLSVGSRGRHYVRVVNESNYDVVLLFLHEDKLRTKSSNTTITRGADANIGGGLAGLADGAVGVNACYKRVEQITAAAQDCVVAMKGRFSRGQECKIHFLPACKELRVLGWRRLPHDEKQLSLWKNSLYGRSVRITLKTKADFKPVIEDVEEVPWVEMTRAACRWK